MSYRLSKARREFESQISQTKAELAALHGRVVTAGGNGSRLLGAYYVFAFAQFEVYVKTLVEDAIQALYSSGPALSQLPDLMVGYLLHRGGNDLGAEYRRFATSEDEGALLEKVGATARQVASWGVGGTPIVLDASAFLHRKKYPSPKNIPQLFRRLGIRRVWADVSRLGRFNAEFTLTSLNDLRTAIAHEGQVPTGFNIRDFRDRLHQMERFVAAMDRCVAAHFCAGPMSWTDWNRQVA
jgi:hypothetical protein